MTCEEARAFLEAVGGDVPRDAACAEHLRECPDCSAYAARLPAETAAFSKLFSRPVDESSFHRVRAGVARRIGQPERSNRSARRRPVAQPQRWGWALPIAALIGVSVLGAFALQRNEPTKEQPVDTAEATPKDKTPERPTPVQNPAPVQPQRKNVAEKQPPVRTPAPQRTEVVKAPPPPVKAPPVETANNPKEPPVSPVGPRLAQLRSRVREQKVLDDVEQLTIAFNDSGDLEARSVTEDAELYLERLLSSEGGNPDEARQVLADSRSAAEQLHKIQESVIDDAPAPLKNALQRTLAALDDAAVLVADIKPGNSNNEAAQAMAQAETHYNHSEYGDALNGYRTLAERFPNDSRAVHARYTMAFILQTKMNGRNEEARTIFQSIADAHSHGLAPHALYHIGESWERSGDNAKALAVYEKLLKAPQGHGRAASLREKVAFLEAMQKGVTQLSKPGWAKDVPKTLHLTSPRPVKLKAK